MGCGSSKGKRQDEKDSAQKDTKGEGTEQDKQDTEGSGQDSPPSLKLQKKREPSAAKEESTPLSLKFKLVGPKKTGKTSLSLRWGEDKFYDDEVPHKERRKKTLNLEDEYKAETVPNPNCEIDVYDVKDEDFLSEERAELKGISCFLLVFDMTERDSFKALGEYVKVINKYADSESRSVVVATRLDLEDKRVVSEDQGRDFAGDNGLSYYEVSNEDGAGVDECFRKIAVEYLRNQKELIHTHN